MYSLSAEGIQLIVPLVSDNCFIKKIITSKIVKEEKWLSFFLQLRLHLLWAAPRYSPVKWQWSLAFFIFLIKPRLANVTVFCIVKIIFVCLCKYCSESFKAFIPLLGNFLSLVHIGIKVVLRMTYRWLFVELLSLSKFPFSQMSSSHSLHWWQLRSTPMSSSNPFKADLDDLSSLFACSEIWKYHHVRSRQLLYSTVLMNYPQF